MTPESNYEIHKTDFYTSCFSRFDFEKKEFPQWYHEDENSLLCYTLHFHKELEIFYVEKGHINVLIEGESFELYEGNILLINPYETHEALIARNCKLVSYYYFTFDMEKLLQFPCQQLYDRLNPILQGKKSYRHFFPGSTQRTMLEIVESMLKDQSRNNSLLLFSDLLRLFECIGVPDSTYANKRMRKSDNFAREVMDFIQHSEPAHISLEDIASHFSYNKNYFSLMFHKKMGMSVTEFCLKYKIELAQRLILEGNRNLNEVCTLSGFNHYTYFFREFRKIVGLTPSDYIKSCIEEPNYRKNDALALEKESNKENKIMTVQSRVLSALVKVFEQEDPASEPESLKLTALKGEHISFQITYLASEKCEADLHISSSLSQYIKARTVEYIPSGFVGYKEHIEADRNYLKKKPCRFPDCLREIPDGKIQLKKQKYRTVWIETELPEDIMAGRYEIKVSLLDLTGEVLTEDTQILTVCDAVLPPQKLIYTDWFHADCLADYYGCEVFSEEHWVAVENFMKTAVKRGQNMIYTPIFTPPLDTEQGKERTTVQLVRVTKDNGDYSFDFELLDRWVELALKCGFTYFEISHLASQGGAVSAPKVMATVDGEYKRIFGWDNLLSEKEYPEFLSIFLPLLTKELERLEISSKCYFHISDEPRFAQMETYLTAKNAIAPYLKGYKIMDALSNTAFFDTGAVEYPVPTTDRIQFFLEKNIPERWTYYCCTQGIGCSNRFFAMKLSRTRAIGLQLFKFHIDGFLHWGFNFYNSAGSTEHLNPYQVSDASSDKEGTVTGFPSGDAYVVYPGSSYTPEESIRLLAFEAGLNDLRALQALSEKTSFEYVLSIIEEDLENPITFSEFPTSDFYYIRLRNRINTELEKNS